MSQATSTPTNGGPSRPPRRHVVKVLDPQTAAQASGGREPARTLYLADRLLVVGDPGPAEDAAATQQTLLGTADEPTSVIGALARLNCSIDEQHPVEVTRPSASRDVQAFYASGAAADTMAVTSLAVSRREGEQSRPADAWEVLQELRRTYPELARRVRLEHVVRPACGYWNGIGGTSRTADTVWHGVGDEGDGGYWGGTGGYWGGTGGYWGGTGGYWGGTGGYWGGTGGYWGGTGVAKAEYDTPGRGGRLPVSVVLPDPALRAHTVSRHPVVALPDTGLGPHPWFADGATWPGTDERQVLPPDGLSELPNSDATAHIDEFSGARGRLHGHGTFIAGIVRQGCPEATLLPVPVMSPVGTAAERDILEVLQRLLDRHRAALAGQGPAEHVLDVLSLSIGYYASADEDDDDTLDGDDAEDLRDLLASPVAALLRQFGEHGVLVVAGVGNDATAGRFLPAALAPAWTGEADDTAALPLVSVGALNPDGVSIAMFSNSGSYTTTYRKGVSVVSTLPTTNSASQSSFRFTTRAGDRATVDVDDYSQGFGVWSGTSFAAPTLAAELAAALVETDLDEGTALPRLDDTRLEALKRRGWRALATVLRPTEENAS